MRNYIKISQCPPSAEQILKLANSLPSGYRINFEDYPAFDADKQKKWFFDLVSTLPKDFFEDKELLKMVINGETISPDKIIKQKNHPLYEELSKIPPKILKSGWREYFGKNGNYELLYPLEDLTKGYIQSAISCRSFLTIFCLNMSGLSGLRYTSGGKAVLVGTTIKDCHFTIKMALYKRENSKYWWMKFHFDGQLVQQSTKCSNKRDALTVESAFRTQLALGQIGIKPKAKAPTFKQAVE
jgi:hypothetical protein